MYSLLHFVGTNPVDLKLYKEPKYAQVVYITCSNNWYNVEAGWTFTVGGNVCEIPAGQYDIDNLASAIQVEVRAETGDSNYTCTFNTDKNRLVLATTTGNFTIASVNSNFARVSGFVADRSGASTYDAENPPNLTLGDVYVCGLNDIIRISDKAFGASVVIPSGNINDRQIHDRINYVIPMNNDKSNRTIYLNNQHGLSMDDIELSIMLSIST